MGGRKRPKVDVLAKMYEGCQAERDRQEQLGTSRVPTEDILESIEQLGVEVDTEMMHLKDTVVSGRGSEELEKS